MNYRGRDALIALAISAAAAFGASAMAAPVAIDVTGADGQKMMGDPDAGAKTFNQCKTCHTNEKDKNKVGPTLYGVIGRKAGTVPGFNYSDANKNSGLTWTEQEIFTYLESPQKTVPGTKMTFPGLKKPEDRANVIAYLQESFKAAGGTAPAP